MTSKLIALIESELPEFFDNKIYQIDFYTYSLEEKESVIENELKQYYPNENQIEQRNQFRLCWNNIIKENEK